MPSRFISLTAKDNVSVINSEETHINLHINSSQNNENDIFKNDDSGYYDGEIIDNGPENFCDKENDSEVNTPGKREIDKEDEGESSNNISSSSFLDPHDKLVNKNPFYRNRLSPLAPLRSSKRSRNKLISSKSNPKPYSDESESQPSFKRVYHNPSSSSLSLYNNVAPMSLTRSPLPPSRGNNKDAGSTRNKQKQTNNDPSAKNNNRINNAPSIEPLTFAHNVSEQTLFLRMVIELQNAGAIKANAVQLTSEEESAFSALAHTFRLARSKGVEGGGWSRLRRELLEGRLRIASLRATTGLSVLSDEDPNLLQLGLLRHEIPSPYFRGLPALRNADCVIRRRENCDDNNTNDNNNLGSNNNNSNLRESIEILELLDGTVIKFTHKTVICSPLVFVPRELLAYPTLPLSYPHKQFQILCP